MGKSQVSVGLEVGEEFLRGVILKKGIRGGHSIVYAAEWSLPKEEEKQKPILTQAITALKEKAGANPTPEWFGTIQGPKVCLRLIQVPRVPNSELKGAVMWEARNQLPFPLDQSFTDHQVLGEIEGEGGARQLLVMLAAAQQEVVRERLERFQKLGVRLSGFSVPAALIWDGCRHLIEPSDHEVYALVNVENGKTIVCVGEGALLKFTREILLVGRYPVSDDPLGPEEVRSGRGHPLVRELKRSFDYYQECHKGETVKKIILCGGMACGEGLAELLSVALQVSVVAVDPFRKLGFLSEGLADGSEKQAFRSAAFTVATTAVLAASGINLLPARSRPRTPFRLHKALIPVAALPLVFLGYSYWSLTTSEREYRRLYQARQQAFAKFQEEEKQLLRLKEREKQLTELLAQVPQGSAESVSWKDLFRQMARLLPQNVALRQMTFNSGEGADQVNGSSEGKETPAGLKVTLEGSIFGSEAEVLAGLAGLMEALQEAGGFEAIGLSSPLKKNKEFSSPAVDFGLAFEVVIGARRPPARPEPPSDRKT